MSKYLSERCKGLVVTVVNQYDMIPYLSLGMIKDIRNAINYINSEENDGVCEKIFSKIMKKNKNNIFNKTNDSNLNEKNSEDDSYSDDDVDNDYMNDQEWLWNLLKNIRKTFTAKKLYPPGSIYWVKTNFFLICFVLFSFKK